METCYFFTKSNATGAMDASIHVSYYKRSDILVLDCSLKLVVSACLVSEEMRIVL